MEVYGADGINYAEKKNGGSARQSSQHFPKSWPRRLPEAELLGFSARPLEAGLGKKTDMLFWGSNSSTLVSLFLLLPLCRASSSCLQAEASTWRGV